MTSTPRFLRLARRAFAALAAGAVGLTPILLAPTAEAHPHHRLPPSYALSGDPEGSRFEGIGYDQRSGAFYVSETTGGEIHRGNVRRATAKQWLAGDGTDGRWTARGV